ncbi:MAG TPA: hypothetical protein VM369_12305 [Candidatus Binatia bacterium]|nr:hypothetical protein [Candidatus Binatia bacterium]
MKNGKPVPCVARSFVAASSLPLPPPRSEIPPARKGRALEMADAVPIGGGVKDIGVWKPAGPGWSAWRLKLSSDGAKSLSVRLQPFDLPSGSELWLCTPDGARQGPYSRKGPAKTARLQTPALPGGELWLEVLAPVEATSGVQVRIVDAYVGFR